MDKYIVIVDIFKDSEDKHVYHKGDNFPFDDRKIDAERIDSLSTTNNKMNQKLIRIKKLEEYSIEELNLILQLENIEVEDKEKLIKKIKEIEKEKNKIRKELTNKNIVFEEHDNLEKLKELLTNEK